MDRYVHTFPKVATANTALMQTASRDFRVYSASDIIAYAIGGYFTAKFQPKFHSRMIEAIINTASARILDGSSNPRGPRPA